MLRRIQKSSIYQPPPLPRRCTCSVSNILSEERNSSTSIVKESSRTRPFYFRRCKRVRLTIESLPDDVLFHIFVRLPADHLYDIVRLVCRRWCRVIHSHAFINTQVQHSTYGLLISIHSPYRADHSLFFSGIEIARMSYKGTHIISCSCNGLVLWHSRCTNDSHILHIINPATKQLFVLPPISGEGRADFCRAGIAYAAASMEYKVIVRYRFPNDSYSSVCILTVGVDSSWRHLPVGGLPRHARMLLSAFPKSTEGFIHWAVLSHFDVLTLDVETEVFSMSVVPVESSDDSFWLLQTRRSYLTTGRYLSMLAPLGDWVFEVWVMEPESGEWRKPLADINLEAQKGKLKRFARGLRRPMLLALGWVNYPEVLAMNFLSRSSRDKRAEICILYNLNTHEITSIDLPHSIDNYVFVPHKNNLMWLT